MSMIIGKSFDFVYFFSISTFYDMLVPSPYSTDTFLKTVSFFVLQIFPEDVFLLLCKSILALYIIWSCFVLITYGTAPFYPYFWTKTFLPIVLFFNIPCPEDVFLLICNFILAFDIFCLCFVLLTYGTKNFYPYFWTKYLPPAAGVGD